MKFKHVAASAITAAVLFVAGCGGGGIGGTGSPAAMGTVRVSVTDAPACGFDSVNVTIQKVRVHQNQDAADADSGWSEIIVNPARRVNLLTLTNGVLEELGQTSLPAGKYQQVRLVLAENSTATPLANSVVPTGGTETALTTPSGTQTGIKLNADIDVTADKVLDVALDFDACKSVVKHGNSGQYNLKPVISVIPILSDAGLRVVGYVDPSIALTTSVSVQASGIPVKATTPDAAGKFVLYPVPVGSYDLVVSSPGHVTAVMTGVPVITTAFTNVNTAALPITPPTATTRNVTGTVTPVTASVVARQTFTGGPAFEVAWGSVDSTTGAFSFALPIEAPVKTAYVANPVALSFAADAAAAGKYTLAATSDSATKTQAIDVSAVVPPVTLILP